MPAGPLSGRIGQAAVWTGKELLIWGGWNPPSPGPGVVKTALGDGASYDPSTGTWETLPPAPIAGRIAAAAVWDGTGVFIWGGQASAYYADGAIYDPGRRSWSLVPRAPLSARADADALWTGSQVIVLGGYGPNGVVTGDGAAYTPATAKWSMLPAIPGPAPVPPGTTSELEGVSAAWTGSQVVVLATYAFQSTCGPNCGGFSFPHAVAAAWTPGAPSWRTLPPPPPQVSTDRATLTWTGTRLVASGGTSCLPVMDCVANPPGRVGQLEFSTGHWTAGAEILPDPTAPQLWTGRSLIVFGSGPVDPSNSGTATDLTQLYDPSTQSWTPMPSPDVRNVGAASVAWTGSAVLLWAGNPGTYPQFLMYAPATPSSA